MDKLDEFGFNMSVSAAKKKKLRRRGTMSGESETSTRICDAEGCTRLGKFRAPRSPDTPDEFYWFCQAHASEYNKRWNFFENAADDKTHTHAARDPVWNQHSNPPHNEQKAWHRLGIEDPHQVLGHNATLNPSHGAAGRRLSSKERRALNILDCKASNSKAQIRTAYKELIKILHPDNNGGDRSQEEQLQEVVWAWDQIKDSRNFKN